MSEVNEWKDGRVVVKDCRDDFEYSGEKKNQ